MSKRESFLFQTYISQRQQTNATILREKASITLSLAVQHQILALHFWEQPLGDLELHMRNLVNKQAVTSHLYSSVDKQKTPLINKLAIQNNCLQYEIFREY